MAVSSINIVIAFVSFIAAVIYSGQSAFLTQKLNELFHWKTGCNPIQSVGNVSLHYFSGRGRAEAIRLLMEDHHIIYTETKFTKFTWPEAKVTGIEAAVYLFGQVPAIVTSKGKHLVQSKVILQHLGRSVGLDCDCRDLEKCDILAAGIDDLHRHRSKYIYNPEFNLQMRNEYIQTILSQWLIYFENLTPSNSYYFASERLTWIDYLMFDMIDSNCNFINSTNQNTPLEGEEDECTLFLMKFTRLTQFYNYFQTRENVANYLKSNRRPLYTMPYPLK